MKKHQKVARWAQIRAECEPEAAEHTPAVLRQAPVAVIKAARNNCHTTTAGWWFGYKYFGGYAEVKLAGQFVEFGEGVRLTDDYGEAGIGFNFKIPNSQTENISSRGGYCITYSSDGDIKFKLAHDENTYDYWCTFEAHLPPSPNRRTVFLSFNGDFTISYGVCQAEKSVILENATGIKIGTPSSGLETPPVNFTIHRLGWRDDCYAW